MVKVSLDMEFIWLFCKYLGVNRQEWTCYRFISACNSPPSRTPHPYSKGKSASKSFLTRRFHFQKKIGISSIVISFENSYLPLIHFPSCYRTACYRTACYRTACYRIACYRTVCYQLLFAILLHFFPGNCNFYDWLVIKNIYIYIYITSVITDRIGLHSVLLPLLIILGHKI